MVPIIGQKALIPRKGALHSLDIVVTKKLLTH